MISRRRLPLMLVLAAAFAAGPIAAASQEPDAALDPAPSAQAAPREALAGAPAAEEPAPRDLNVGVLDDAAGFSVPGRFGLRSGFDVDVALELCERINARCTLTPLPAGELLGALDDRRIAMAVAALVPPGYGDKAYLYTDPYVELVQRFVMPRVLRERAPGAGVVRAAIKGTAQAAHLAETSQAPDRVVLYGERDGMWIDLAMGRLDAALASALPARQEFLATPLGEGYRLAAAALGVSSGPAIAASVALRPGEHALRDDLNAAIGAFIATPDYQRLLNRHLDAGLARQPGDP